jgi:hypothetical protein
VRVWGLGAAALLTAALACLLSWAALSAVLPRPNTTVAPGAVLETVTPAQLAAMGIRLDPALQPVPLPDWLTTRGLRPPSTILMPDEVRAIVRKSNPTLRQIDEVTLGYATVTGGRSAQRFGGLTISHRLVWAVTGSRASVGTAGNVLQVLWLVDAHGPRQLVELPVPVVLPPAGAAPPPAGLPSPAGG